jgi:hypothetical protein
MLSELWHSADKLTQCSRRTAWNLQYTTQKGWTPSWFLWLVYILRVSWMGTVLPVRNCLKWDGPTLCCLILLCSSRRWIWLSEIGQNRATREVWHLLTVETEVNGDSKSTNEMGPSLVGSLSLSRLCKRFLSCLGLGCSSRPSTKYLYPLPGKLGRQSCWVVCLLVCFSGSEETFRSITGREKNSIQTNLFNIWIIGTIDRTSGQAEPFCAVTISNPEITSPGWWLLCVWCRSLGWEMTLNYGYKLAWLILKTKKANSY